MINIKKLNKQILFACGLVVLFVIAIVGFFTIKSSQYKQALLCFEAGNYEEAEQLFIKLNHYKDAPQYVYECQYVQAESSWRQGEYTEAIKLFEQLGSYKDSLLYATKCHYENAKLLYEKAEYEEAKQEFSLAGDYSDTSSYIEKCEHQIAISAKYKNYDLSAPIVKEAFVFGESPLTDQELDDMGFHSPEDVEEYLSHFYSLTWYDEETGEPMEFTATTINNQPYHVVAALSLFDGEETDVIYYHPSDPNTYYYLTNYTYLTSPAYVEGLILSGLGTSSFSASYLNVTPEEFNELLMANREPAYSDDTIVAKTLSMFQDRIRSQYGMTPNVLYHGASVQSSSVIFDPYTNSYQCTLNASYTTNIFDIYGFSSTSYVVTAVYLDTGYELILSDFTIR